MERREFLRVGAASAVGMTLGFPAFGAKAGGNRPNILFIITDQQHHDALSVEGERFIRTPALDRLARRGVRFSRSYSSNPVCSPARSSMFTGRCSSETGVFVNNRGIRSGMSTMGEVLTSQADYECVYAGKWHLPQTHTLWIPGFRVLSTGLGLQGNVGDTFTSQACAAFLRNRSQNRPFCMVASFLQPHDICEWLILNSERYQEFPYPEIRKHLPPLPANFRPGGSEPEVIRRTRQSREGLRYKWNEEHWRYYRWAYFRHVEMVDAEIGRLLEALEEAGLARDTLVVFTSDHGEGTAHHQMTRKNFLYDEAVRVPLIFSFPGTIGANRVDHTRVVSGLDILPTVCAAAGVPPPPHVRGYNLLPVLRGGTAPGGEFCVSEVQGNTGRMVRTDRFKMIRYKDDPTIQLFDMIKDPGETRNLAGDAHRSDTVRDLTRLLRDWETRLDPAPNTPARDYWRKIPT